MDWLTFHAAVGTILTALAVQWINPATGYGDDFVAVSYTHQTLPTKA